MCISNLRIYLLFINKNIVIVFNPLFFIEKLLFPSAFSISANVISGPSGIKN